MEEAIKENLPTIPTLRSFLKRKKNRFYEIAMLCFCVAPFQLLKTLYDFNETCYESYAIGGHPDAVLLTP
jgi:hypothetical protein